MYTGNWKFHSRSASRWKSNNKLDKSKRSRLKGRQVVDDVRWRIYYKRIWPGHFYIFQVQRSGGIFYSSSHIWLHKDIERMVQKTLKRSQRLYECYKSKSERGRHESWSITWKGIQYFLASIRFRWLSFRRSSIICSKNKLSDFEFIAQRIIFARKQVKRNFVSVLATVIIATIIVVAIARGS